MKSLVLAAAALVLASGASAASYRGRSSAGYKRSVSQTATGGASHIRGTGSNATAFSAAPRTWTTASANWKQAMNQGQGVANPGDTPGWLSNPTPGALIRTAGMGYKISDGGPARNTGDYNADGWGGTIAMNEHTATNAVGAGPGIRQGPKDTAPYPANSGSGGSGSGAGGNGVFTNGIVFGLNSAGQTITTQGGNNGH